MDVSVIIPTYRPGPYLKECLASLARQTLSAHRFEVIIVLNGCDEPYRAMVAEYAGEMPRACTVRLLHTLQAGVSNARNMGMDMAAGDYLCFIDDDDWVSPTFLERLLAMAGEGVVAVSNVLCVDERSGQVGSDYLSVAYQQLCSAGDVSVLRARRMLSTVWCKLMPREMVAGRTFDKQCALGEDALFMASLTDRIRALRCTQADAIYYRRLSAGSASRRHRSLREKAANCCMLYARYVKVYLSNPCGYSTPFFINRLAAVSKWWFR